MSKIEAVCPYCHKANALEVASLSKVVGLQNIQCSHCSKRWDEDLSATSRFIKSAPAPSSELAALRVQVRAQMDELLKKINALIERRPTASGPARFNTTGREVEKSDVAAKELEKALANGKPVTFETEASTSARFQTIQTIGVGERTAPGGRFVPDGFEKNDAAAEELKKSLARPIRIG